MCYLPHSCFLQPCSCFFYTALFSSLIAINLSTVCSSNVSSYMYCCRKLPNRNIVYSTFINVPKFLSIVVMYFHCSSTTATCVVSEHTVAFFTACSLICYSRKSTEVLLLKQRCVTLTATCGFKNQN